MKSKTVVILMIVLMISTLRSYSQTFSMIDEIKKQMSEAEQEELDKTKLIINEGDDLVEAGEKLLTESEGYETNADNLSGSKKKSSLKKADKLKKEAYVKLVAGQEKYEVANKIIYNLYKKNLKVLRETLKDENKISQLNELEIESNTYFAQATSARKKSEKQEEDEQKYTFDVEADQLETDAISIQIQAYSIVYGWFEPEVGEVVEVVKDDIIPETHPKDTANVKVDTTSNVVVQKKEPIIVYKIQIAASDVQLSMTKLSQIYPTSEIVFTDIDGDWYKYMVGNYKTYEEAYTAKTKMGVQGAFIVAYKDNVRVKNITEVHKLNK